MYRAVAQAGILIGRGRPDDAADALDAVITSEPVTPAAHALAAELYWRCGRPDTARRLAEPLLEGVPAYLRVSVLVVLAQCTWRDGDKKSAHALLEEALALGDAQSLLRPFNRPDAELADLLAEHADAGTEHAHFLGRALARQRAASSREAASAPIPGTRLSAREIEVLGLLQTRLTSAEIAQELFISPNTLKSHVKSIYRKLGVESRRDAIRVSRGTAHPGRGGQVSSR